MGEFDALRRAGRPGGVDQRTEVLPVAAVEPRLERLVVVGLGTEVVDVRERVDVLAVGVLVGDLVDDDDTLQVEVVLDREQRLQQCLVLDDTAHRLVVGEEVLDLWCRRLGVDRRDDPLCALDGKVGVRPLHSGVPVDADPVVRLDAEFPEAGREMSDDVTHLAVAETAVLAGWWLLDDRLEPRTVVDAPLEPLRVERRVPLDRFEEQLRDRRLPDNLVGVGQCDLSPVGHGCVISYNTLNGM